MKTMSRAGVTERCALFLALLSVSLRGEAQGFALYAQAAGGPALGSFSSVSPAAYGIDIGLEARGVLADSLVLALEPGYSAYASDVDWAKSLGQARVLGWGGWRFPLGEAFSLTPRAGLGLGWAFGSVAVSDGSYESRSALQVLALAGVVADYSLSQSLSLRAALDLRWTAESGGSYSSLSLGLGAGWKISGASAQARKPTQAEPSPAPLAAADEAPPAEAAPPEPVEAAEPAFIAEAPPEEPPAPAPEPASETRAERQAAADSAAQALASDLAQYPNIRVVAEEDSGVRLILEGTFLPDSASLTVGTKEQLAAVIRSTASLDPARVTIRGYAARVGPEEADVPLSEARSESARSWLDELGFFPGVPVESLAMGSAEPAGDNGTAKGRARNRRVEIQIVLHEDGRE